MISLQIRSHAQKYFLKVQKNGTNEHLPPPRPKRKAAHPYPQKASKNSQGISLVCRNTNFKVTNFATCLIFVLFFQHQHSYRCLELFSLHLPYLNRVIFKCQIPHLGVRLLVLLSLPGLIILCSQSICQMGLKV